MRSTDYRELAPNSRATYLHAFDFLRGREGAKAQVSAIKASHIERLRDEIAATRPGKANLVGVVKANDGKCVGRQTGFWANLDGAMFFVMVSNLEHGQ
jgi:hypothetical protein